MSPLWRRLADPESRKPLFGFDYPTFLGHFRHAAATLKMPEVVPYHMRHSGPSTDLADRRRTMPEAQKRGRWSQPSSMLRYERRSRLAAEWQKVPGRVRTWCESAASRLAATVLDPPPPKKRAAIRV